MTKTGKKNGCDKNGEEEWTGEGIRQRTSGILMPVSCLPGRYGIGDFGREARMFVDWMETARTRVPVRLPEA